MCLYVDGFNRTSIRRRMGSTSQKYGGGAKLTPSDVMTDSDADEQWQYDDVELENDIFVASDSEWEEEQIEETAFELFAAPDDAVWIPDEALREALLSDYDSNGDGILTESEMEEVKFFSIWSAGVQDLTGLETAKNLSILWMEKNEITDLTPIAGLTNLTELYASENQITDLTPLSGLINVYSLYLSDNNITDLTPISDLINVSSLDLSNNDITDLTPISDLINLGSLDLQNNNITDITPIVTLTSLSSFSITNNKLTDIPDLSGLKRLYMGTEDNPVNIFGGNQIPRENLIGKLPQEPTEKWLNLNSYQTELVDIPDAVLKEILAESYDANGDGELNRSEMTMIDSLDLRGKGITSLEGLQWAISLRALDARENNLPEIPDLTGLTHLQLYEDYDKRNPLFIFTGNKGLTSSEQFEGKFAEELTYSWIYLNSYDSTEVEFPDENLRAAMFEQGCDMDGDGKITVTEMCFVESLDLAGKDISLLEGLQYADALVTLDVSDNNIKDLGCLRNCQRLKNLWARNNQLKELPEFTHPVYQIYLTLYDYDTERVPRDMFSGNELTAKVLAGAVRETISGENIDDWLAVNACDWELTVPVLNQPYITDDNVVHLSWDYQLGRDGYYVYRKTENTDWVMIAEITGMVVNGYDDKDVVGGTTYTYTVEAMRKTGDEIQLSGYDETGVTITVPAPVIMDLAYADIESNSILSYTYTGKEIVPYLNIYISDIYLRKGTDYIIEPLSENINVGIGAGKVLVTGIGAVTGSREVVFDILPASTPDPIVVNKVYTVTYGDLLSSAELPRGWSWQNPDQNVGDVTGVNKTFKADFKAFEGSNYKNVSNVDLKVRVVPRELSNQDVSMSETLFIYDGTEKRPEIVVTSLGRILQEGASADYTLHYTDNIEIGTGKAVVKGVNNYTGTVTLDFEIVEDPYDISKAEVVLTPSTNDYTGKPVEPKVNVRMWGKWLDQDVHYSVSYEENVEPGFGKAVITGIDPYHGNQTVKFRILPTNYELRADYGTKLKNLRLPGDWTWKEPDDYVGDATDEGETRNHLAELVIDGETVEGEFYIQVEPREIRLTEITVDGKNIVYVPQVPAEPEVVVRDPELGELKDPLEENVDYTVTYNSNDHAGNGSVVVEGIGNYKGKVTNHFQIQKADPAPKVESNKIDGNQEIRLTVKEEPFFLYASFIGDGQLSFQSDDEDVFTVAKKINPVTGVEDGELTVTGPGVAKMTVQVLEGINYKASDPVTYLVVVTRVPIDSDDIQLENTSYTYTGNSIHPEFVVTVNGEQLTESVDYTVAFGENINAGKGTVIISGINDYEGDVTAEFEIAKAENPAKAPETVQAVYGQKLEELALDDGWRWKNPELLVGAAGTREAEAVLAETDNYLEKTEKVSIEVAPKVLDESMVGLEYETVEYDGNEKMPSVILSDGTLASPDDYTVAYENNCLPGTAAVIVSAKNNYTGIVTIHFAITARVLRSSDVTVKGRFIYDGTSHKPEPVVTVGDTVLTKDADYVIDSYGENVHAGFGTVVLTGIDKYAGTVTVEFVIEKVENPATPSDAVHAVYGETLDEIFLENGWQWEKPEDSVGTAGSQKHVAFLEETEDYLKKTADITVIVEPKILTSDMVSLEDGIWIFDGTPKQPSVSAIDGISLDASDYHIEYEDNIHAGTARVIVTGSHNYQGAVIRNFAIEKAKPVIEIKAGTTITKYQNDAGFCLEAQVSNGGMLTYSSSDPAVAAVDEEGNVTVGTAGKAMITVAYAGNQDYCEASEDVQITVLKKASEDENTPGEDTPGENKPGENTPDGGNTDDGENTSGGGNSSGNGSSSGGGSSSSSTSATSLPSGYTGPTRIINGTEVPSYVQEGTWHMSEYGIWSFTDGTGQAVTNGWRALYNPYADVSRGQTAFDWFLFDAAGAMKIGWYTDEEGDTYYLNPTSDNTQGRMAVGWWLIDGRYYYFNEASDGKRGRLLKNTKTPDGYDVDENGVWIP